jgi:hypothetical protein
MVGSIAMAAWTKMIPYDNFNNSGDNTIALWIEVALFTTFYQQGVVDAFLASHSRRAPPFNRESGWFTSTLLVDKIRKLSHQLVTTLGYTTNTKVDSPQLTKCTVAVIAWVSWFILSIVPIPDHDVCGGGFRYPAYCRSSAGHFVFRSWAILGLALWWFQHHLPSALKKVKAFASFGFTLYTLHWFFLELAFKHIYGGPVPPGQPNQPGELPWWLGLAIGLCFCFFTTGMCHLFLKAVMGSGVSWKWKEDELRVTIKTAS